VQGNPASIILPFLLVISASALTFNVQPVSLVPLVPKVQAGLSSAALADTIYSLASGVDWSNGNLIIQHTGYLFHRVTSPNYVLTYPNAGSAFALGEARLSEVDGTGSPTSYVSSSWPRCSGADQLPVAGLSDWLVYYRWGYHLYDWFPSSWNRGTALTQFRTAVGNTPALDYPSRTWAGTRYYDEYMETADIYLGLGSVSDAVNMFEADYSTHWNGVYWGYSGQGGIECEAGPFAMIAAKIYVANGNSMEHFDTVGADLAYKFLNSGWSSPLWAGSYVCTHYCDGRLRLENTMAAWAALQLYWTYFTPAQQATMVSMLTGNGGTTAWQHLMNSALYIPAVNKFILLTNDSPESGTPNDAFTAIGLNALFFMGIVPDTGSLAIPLNEEFYEDVSTYVPATNFGFDYANHQIKIPVRAGMLHFLFGTVESSASFSSDGIYTVQFSSDWNIVQSVSKISGLLGNTRYLPIAGGSPPPTETIYIRADGSIDPSTAPISSVDNVTYTLTDNIAGNVPASSSAIIIQRDNIIIDGAGHALQGTQAYESKGIELRGRSNVTIQNMKITAYEYGIWLSSSSNNSVSGNNITTNSGDGIYLYSSSDNSVYGNNISNNGFDGIYLVSSSNNRVSGNNITANSWGIMLGLSYNNTLSGNLFVNDGLYVSGSYGNVVTDNLVNGKPLVYLQDVSDYAVGDAGQVILVKCTNVTVENLNLSNTNIGVELWETNNTTISGSNITNSEYGLYLDSSNNNSVSGNNIVNNGYGLRLVSSSENTIYHNDFINNTSQAYLSNSTNVWDDGYPSGGNYWSDYNGTDLYSGPYQNETGSDGIGDTPYTIDGNNKDNYPLFKARALAVISVVKSKTVIFQGFSGNITVCGANQGDLIETFNVTVYADATSIASAAQPLESGSTTNITLSWDTTGFAKGNYTISAYAWPLPGETNTSDNNFTDGWILVTRVGDLNGDNKCDGRDLIIVSRAFGSVVGVPPFPGESRWNPNADIDNDGKVDGRDIIIVTRHFGEGT